MVRQAQEESTKNDFIEYNLVKEAAVSTYRDGTIMLGFSMDAVSASAAVIRGWWWWYHTRVSRGRGFRVCRGGPRVADGVVCAGSALPGMRCGRWCTALVRCRAGALGTVPRTEDRPGRPPA